MQYIIALRPVVGRGSGLVRVGPEGAQFSLRGVSFGQAHLLLQNGRSLSATVRPTPGGGTAFIRLRGREHVIGAAVTYRGIVLLIGSNGARTSDVLERSKLLAAEPEPRETVANTTELEPRETVANTTEPEPREAATNTIEERVEPAVAANAAGTAETPAVEAHVEAVAKNVAAAAQAEEPVGPPSGAQTSPAKPAGVQAAIERAAQMKKPERPNPEAIAVLAAKEEPFAMPKPPPTWVEEQIKQPEEEAKAPESVRQEIRVSPEPPRQEAAQEECDCAEADRGGQLAAFMLGTEEPAEEAKVEMAKPAEEPKAEINEGRESAKPVEEPEPEFAELANPPEQPRTEAGLTGEYEVFLRMVAEGVAGIVTPGMAEPKTEAVAEQLAGERVCTPHAFYQPVLEEEAAFKTTWTRNLTESLAEPNQPMTGRRLGVFANAFPGDWPRVNWQVFSHPGGTHILRTQMNEKSLFAIPARPTATPPAGIPPTARYCVSRTGQGYWVF